MYTNVVISYNCIHLKQTLPFAAFCLRPYTFVYKMLIYKMAPLTHDSALGNSPTGGNVAKRQKGCRFRQKKLSRMRLRGRSGCLCYVFRCISYLALSESKTPPSAELTPFSGENGNLSTSANLLSLRDISLKKGITFWASPISPDRQCRQLKKSSHTFP